MSKNIRLVQIFNRTNSEGWLTNFETSDDDVSLGANGYTNTPGQYGDGCHIPDCGAGVYWDNHRMTVTLGGNVLSLWKEGADVYCRMAQTVYPGAGRGDYLWEDTGAPVVLNIGADAKVTMTNA